MSKKGKKIVFYLLTLLIFIGFVELTSYIILRSLNNNFYTTNKFNRELSGYMIFKNTPNYDLWCYKDDPSETALRTNKYGFIADEPITKEKSDTNIVRIFLMGGSAMFSAGQTQENDCYKSVKEFPGDPYAYEISIAGRLKSFLRSRYPNKHFEVINAAAYTRELHQSTLYYLTCIQSFHPDIIVNMDGYNDLGNIRLNSTYDLCETFELKQYVNLLNKQNQIQNKPNFFKLIYYLKMKYGQWLYNKLAYSKQPSQAVSMGSMGNTQIQNCQSKIDTSIDNREKYLSVKSYLEQSCQPFVNGLDQYMYLLKANHVKFVFLLQPILARGINKHLAPYEQQLQKADGQHKPQDFTYNDYGDYADDDSLVNIKTYNALKTPDAEMDYLIARYFLDDYLTDELKKHVTDNGFVYADMNKEIEPLDSNYEFYTDYCHMTKAGYQLVGEKIGQLIIDNHLIDQPTDSVTAKP